MSYRPLRAPRHEEILIRGLRHRVTLWGPPSERPIVLLHGFMDCSDTWQFLVDSLPESWSLVAPDWRGFGGSEWAPGGYWFPDYLADLEALLGVFTPRHRARVVGHSMGANIATLYAGVRPDRLQWLINLEGIGLPRVSADLAPARFAQWLDELQQPPASNRYASVEQLATVLLKRNPRLGADRAQFVALAWTRRDDAGEVRLAFDPRHRLVNPILYRREEAESCWVRVSIPMLLLAGGGSEHLPRRLAEFDDEKVQTLFKDVRIVSLPGLGHMMHHEDPQAVAAHLVEFVRDRD